MVDETLDDERREAELATTEAAEERANENYLDENR
jgi:hypothetical protein